MRLYNDNNFFMDNLYKSYNKYENTDEINSLYEPIKYNTILSHNNYNKRSKNIVHKKNPTINCSEDDINFIKIKMNIDLLNNRMIQINKAFSKIDQYNSNNKKKKSKRKNHSVNYKDNGEYNNFDIYDNFSNFNNDNDNNNNNDNINDYNINNYYKLGNKCISKNRSKTKIINDNKQFVRSKSKKNIINNKSLYDNNNNRDNKDNNIYDNPKANQRYNNYYNSPLIISKQGHSGQFMNFQKKINKIRIENSKNLDITHNYFTIIKDNNNNNENIENKINIEKSNININFDNLCFGPYDNYFLETLANYQNKDNKENLIDLYMDTMCNEKEDINNKIANPPGDNKNNKNIKHLKDLIINNKKKCNNNYKINKNKNNKYNNNNNDNDDDKRSENFDNIYNINNINEGSKKSSDSGKEILNILNKENKNDEKEKDNFKKNSDEDFLDIKNKENESYFSIEDKIDNYINNNNEEFNILNNNDKNNNNVEIINDDNDVIIKNDENQKKDENNDIIKVNKNENNNNINKNKNKGKKISIHEEDNISIEYNQKDKSTKILIFDFFGEQKNFKPKNINSILEKLKSVKLNSILLNKDASDNLIRLPNDDNKKNKEKSKEKIKGKYKGKSQEKITIKKALPNITISNKEKNMLNKNKTNCVTKKKNKIVKKNKKICEKFKNNPQLFYTENLCSLVIKSLDLSNEEDNKEKNKIVVNKNKKDTKINEHKEIDNRKDIYIDDIDNEPFSNLQKIIEESDEENERINN